MLFVISVMAYVNCVLRKMVAERLTDATDALEFVVSLICSVVVLSLSDQHSTAPVTVCS